MIVSASRRTDIPAFYAEWFMGRVRAGHCRVPNPVCPAQVGTVPLSAERVDAIVFWTRHARPMLRHLPELDRLGHRYYFLYTVLDYPRLLDRCTPVADVAVATFRELARRLGPERVIWRYDPIVWSNLTGAGFHAARFERLADRLAGSTRRCIVSFLDRYRKTEPRLRRLAARGLCVAEPPAGAAAALMARLADLAAERGIELQACAEPAGRRPRGVSPGKCIDDGLIARVFGRKVTAAKDPAQRAACRCVASRDIGMYNTCRFGCRYCYATASFEQAAAAHRRHDPAAESLAG